MKTTAGIFLYLFLAISSLAWPLKTASFIVHAEDEDQLPVSNAVVSVDFYRDSDPGFGVGLVRDQAIVANTDTNGLCHIEGKCNGSIGWNVTKTGYYLSYGPRIIVTNASLTRWEPWGQQYEVVMRKILSPVPMYAKGLQGVQIPAQNESLSFDLGKGDWVSPHGNGQIADFVFRLDCVLEKIGEDGIQYFDGTLSIAFSNEGDGILEFPDSQPPMEGSIFHLPRYAPEEGYTNRWSLRIYRTRQGSNDLKPQSDNLNYFYRVRTKKDEAGKIISAQYGKIRNPIEFGITPGKTTLRMCYYLNPTPNDRNMEFDPKQNLFTDLKVGEQVQEP